MPVKGVVPYSIARPAAGVQAPRRRVGRRRLASVLLTCLAGCQTATAGLTAIEDCFETEPIPESPELVGWATWSEVEVIAHRGYACCSAENTLPAIEAAVDFGALAVELDVRTTRDGVAVLLHDDTLDRTTDVAGAVSAASWADLVSANACLSHEGACSVPTVDEALALARGRTKVVLDLKDATTCSAFRPIATAIAKSGEPGSVAIISGDPATLRMARNAFPNLPLGIYTAVPEELDVVAIAKRLGHTEIFLEAELVRRNHPVLRRALRANIPITAWTIHWPEEIELLLDMPIIARVLSDVPPRVGSRLRPQS